MPTAEILSQGHEVVTGQVADTNAAWLSTRLVDLGFHIHRHTSVGDHVEDIRSLFREAVGRSPVCVCTGGLGPTADDLTAEAVAAAFDRPLVFDEVAMAHIEALYERFGRKMPEVNRKQAWLPTGAIRLDNHWGTAPGFALEVQGHWLICVPGVPSEMRKMWQHRILPLLTEQFALQPGELVTLRCTGIGESNLQERVGEVAGAVVSYRTKLPENHLKLLFAGSVPDEARSAVVAEVVRRIGSPLFTVENAPPLEGLVAEGLDLEGGSLAEVVGRSLAARGETLAVAESCTGGRIAAELTAIPGSSGWFYEGVVTYANHAKVRLLGVDEGDLSTHGAVSEVVVRQMAAGCLARAGTTWALATSGVAGPGGGSADKPVGTVHLALAGPGGVHHRLVRLAGSRARIQGLAVGAALDMLRRQLAGL